MESFSVSIFNEDLLISFSTYQFNPVIWRRVVDCSASNFDQLDLDMLAVHADSA